MALSPGGPEDSAVTEMRRPPQRRLESPARPEHMRLWLADGMARPNARDSFRPGCTLGPIFLGVGTWTFRIAGIRKGIGADGFDQVRARLRFREF